MVDRAALEMQCTARYRGFESLSLRQVGFNTANIEYYSFRILKISATLPKNLPKSLEVRDVYRDYLRV